MFNSTRLVKELMNQHIANTVKSTQLQLPQGIFVISGQ